MRDELLSIFARIRLTICDTYSSAHGNTREGRISEADLNRLIEMSGVERDRPPEAEQRSNSPRRKRSNSPPEAEQQPAPEAEQ